GLHAVPPPLQEDVFADDADSLPVPRLPLHRHSPATPAVDAADAALRAGCGLTVGQPFSHLGLSRVLLSCTDLDIYRMPAVAMHASRVNVHGRVRLLKHGEHRAGTTPVEVILDLLAVLP